MKNLSQRSKIVLAIVGVLVIVVIAVAVFAQVGGSELFGASTPPVILPTNSAITVGGTVRLNMSTGSSNCTWSVPYAGAYGTRLVDLSPTSGGSTVVTSVNMGTQRIIARCDNGQTSANVTVIGPPTPTPLPLTISPANPRVNQSNFQINDVESVTLTALNAVGGCSSWTVSPMTDYYYWNNSQVTLANEDVLTVTATAHCGNGSASTTVTFNNLR